MAKHFSHSGNTMTEAKKSSVIRLKGCAQFRQRIAMSILSMRPVIISDIRVATGGAINWKAGGDSADGESGIGIRSYESKFLHLIERMSNGCRISINDTGTVVRFYPGVLQGGGIIRLGCGTDRAITYFIEGIIPLLPFGKKQFTFEFEGITNNDVDISIDRMRLVTTRLCQYFGIPESIEIKILRRGAPPIGIGKVLFTCPVVRKLHAVQLSDFGLVKSIRGVAYATKVSPQMCNRMINAARRILNGLIPDVHISSDHSRGNRDRHAPNPIPACPGFGLMLFGETTEGCLLGADGAAAKKQTVPEDVGSRVANALLAEIEKGGYVDSAHQPLLVTLMALTTEDVSKVCIGKLSAPCVNTLRLLRTFLGIVFQITPVPGENTVMLTCVGSGAQNVAKKVT